MTHKYQWYLIDSFQGMTNDNNPFGDSNLTETFVWEKKLKKEGLSSEPMENLRLITTQKIDENKVRLNFFERIWLDGSSYFQRELEKLEKQRLERARQREAIEKEKETLQRLKEAEYHRVWEKQEDAVSNSNTTFIQIYDDCSILVSLWSS